jgi:hypothetical protein
LGSNKDNKKKIITINILNENENDSIDNMENNRIDNIKNNRIENFSNEWTNYRTNNLFLIETSNPWYINKHDIIPEKYIDNSDYLNENRKEKQIPYGYRKKMYNNEEYKTDVILNTNDPALGLGYSILDRSKIESFNNEKERDNSNYIILLMFILIIILFVYNVYKNKKNNKKI